MPTAHLAQATPWITAAATQHGADLLPVVMQRLQLTRRRAQAVLQQLVQAQWLERSGSARKPVYRAGTMRQAVKTYPLAGLDEDHAWRRDFLPLFELAPNVAELLHYAFTELVNNAVDHSGGSAVTISLRQTALHLQLLVSDDGCGLFDRVGRELAIDEPGVAMFELAKGKLTTQPERHRGHGLFFTARMADVFNVQANHAAFQRLGLEQASWGSARAVPRQGTTVYLAIDRDTPRTLGSVLQSASHIEGGYGLQRTQLPLRLLASNGLISRSQARRVLQRLASFDAAELDFGGVQMLGHSFVDELLRVNAAGQTAPPMQMRGLRPELQRMLADWSLPA